MWKSTALLFSILSCFSWTSYAQEDSLLNILSEELNREFSVLSEADIPAYYMDYTVNEISTISIRTNQGSLIQSQDEKRRIAKATVRVGDYSKDNTRQALNRGNANFNASSTSIPLANSRLAIQKALWQVTHAAYLTASKQYKKVQTLDEDEQEVPDFSQEEAVRSVDSTPVSKKPINKRQWENFLTNLSERFLTDEDIVSGNVDLSYTTEKKYFTSTEGAYILQTQTYAHLSINASVRCFDGEIVPLYKSYFAFDVENLPKEAELKIDIENMILNLNELKNAPLAEPYTGPALLHARVAGVFFHEIFGHRIEGHRLKSKTDGQTFKEKINEMVLPKSINIFSDPSLMKYNDQDLIGSYKYDDEGIQAQKVQIVEKGVLKSFLMSRSPLEEFQQSNGHGRCQAGLNPVSRQSNLIIESLQPLNDKKLRKTLLQECVKQGKEYGYYFVDVTGGFTRTDRYNTNSFNIKPTLVYRIYVDKREDELVRGVNLIGTPLAMFAEIEAAGDVNETFTGICGAESGGVPVSATAPALFVKRIETQKKPSSLSNVLPILTRPKSE